jgi:hypothetical protein
MSWWYFTSNTNVMETVYLATSYMYNSHNMAHMARLVYIFTFILNLAIKFFAT